MLATSGRLKIYLSWIRLIGCQLPSLECLRAEFGRQANHHFSCMTSRKWINFFLKLQFPHLYTGDNNSINLEIPWWSSGLGLNSINILKI